MLFPKTEYVALKGTASRKHFEKGDGQRVNICLRTHFFLMPLLRRIKSKCSHQGNGFGEFRAFHSQTDKPDW